MVVTDVVAYLHELLPYDIPNAVYVSVKRVTKSPSSRSMLRRRLVTTEKWFVHCITGGIQARQTKLSEVETGTVLRRSSLDLSLDAVSCTIASKMVRLESPHDDRGNHTGGRHFVDARIGCPVWGVSG